MVPVKVHRAFVLKAGLVSVVIKNYVILAAVIMALASTVPVSVHLDIMVNTVH